MIDADDRPFPQITEITEALEPPDEEMIASLATVLDGLAEPGRRFAFLRSRPGPGGLTADDRAWRDPSTTRAGAPRWRSRSCTAPATGTS